MSDGSKAGGTADSERRTAESDVEPDEARVDSRDTGGVPDSRKPDQGSTTGTTPNDEFVGRVAGQDLGYAEETGAERRAEAG
ncbi:hypothetical protein [uncultured Jatrophihabitans sp.]|uniref:hypothetical protein n=1 Tax=uncultured Jatrophihabitans sp. TaxID=1610747 RepID=UPI0035C9B5CA